MRPCNSSSQPSALFTAAFAAFFALTLLLSASAFAQTITTLQNFNGTNGANPYIGALTQGRDGKLYGTTYYGGANSQGTVFRFNQATNFISVIHSFAGPEGSSPTALMLATDGNYYGTTNYGGSAGLGVLFKITSGGTYTLLHSFLGGSDGEFPQDAPIQASDGNIYGVTVGGVGTAATVYKYTRSGAYSIVYTLPTSSGAYAQGVMQGSDGNLYVTANGGGAIGCGSIVKLTLPGVLKQVHSFSCTNNGGSYPVAPLIQASNGDYYGTTPDGGSSDFGVLYQLGASFGETVSHTFTSSGARTPEGGLMQGTDGNLYGVSMSSGNLDGGILYTWNPSTLTYSELYQFTGDGNILAPLMQHTSGVFYGTSQEQGTHGDGFLFSVNMSLGPFVALVYPGGKVGSTVEILGQGFTGTTSVTFNGLSSSFTVVSDTYMTAVVPTGATSGAVAVTTPGGTLTSNVNFRVSP